MWAIWGHWREPALNALKPVTVFQLLPKAAAAILALPGVESLERGPDGWCCHLAFGWTTEALGGGGTIIDSNLKTIRAHVTGAYELPPVAAPAPAAAPAPELTTLPLIRRIQAAAPARVLLPGEAVAPAAPAPAGPAPELPEFVTYSQQQQQPQQGGEYRSPARGGRVAWDEPGESAAALAALPVLPPASKYDAPCPPKAAAPTCLVNAGPRARNTAPSHLPDEGVRLLDRFELQFDSVLTVGTSNTKIGKGQAIAHSAGFFGLPAKQLSTAIYGALDAPVAARGRLEAVRRHRPRRVVKLQLACTQQYCLVNEIHRYLELTSGERKTGGFVSQLADAPLRNSTPTWV